MNTTLSVAHPDEPGRPVKLLILSDLHLDRGHGYTRAAGDDADVVVLAGDIHVGVKGIAWARKTFPDKQIVYVAGNHEFYGYRWDKLNEQLRAEGHQHKVHFLENNEVTLFGLRFLGATLWTDFKFFGEEKKALAMKMVHRCLYDYRAIARDANGHAIVPMDTLDRHRASYQWLKERLNETDQAKTVVVTHHYPCPLSTDPQYAKDIVTAGFGSNLDDLIGKSAMWIHGHTHTCFDYVHKGTRIVCNPKGYEWIDRAPENPKFNPQLVLEIPQ